MGLDEEIAAQRAEIRSDGYPMSIGELVSLYRDEELDIHPEFQRFYRWTEEQKTRLIESLLLGIPIPSIFVSQRDDGVWDVIDGLQRLSTILQFIGLLEDDSGKVIAPFTLKRTKRLPSLEGKTWNGDSSQSIGNANQLIIRRSKIDVKIILRESSELSKYELFQRLNTGGTQLSDQELRNAILTMVNPEVFRWTESLASDNNFQTCIPLSDRMLLERYDLELVTRFVVFRDLEEPKLAAIGDIAEFLTDSMVDFARPERFNVEKQVEEEAFKIAFAALEASLGENSFRKYDVEKHKHMGGFLISAFEPIALGLGYNYMSYKDSTRHERIVQLGKELWQNEGFLSRSGGGVRASTRVPTNIPLGRRLFKL